MKNCMLDDDDDDTDGYGDGVLLEGSVDSPRQAIFSLSCSWHGYIGGGTPRS